MLTPMNSFSQCHKQIQLFADRTLSGPGILAFMKFKLIAEGQGDLECRLVDFRDSFNVQTLPACVAGHVHVVGPVQVESVTWGRLKTLHR